VTKTGVSPAHQIQSAPELHPNFPAANVCNGEWTTIHPCHRRLQDNLDGVDQVDLATMDKLQGIWHRGHSEVVDEGCCTDCGRRAFQKMPRLGDHGAPDIWIQPFRMWIWLVLAIFC
jgi:hypothetical protein